MRLGLQRHTGSYASGLTFGECIPELDLVGFQASFGPFPQLGCHESDSRVRQNAGTNVLTILSRYGSIGAVQTREKALGDYLYGGRYPKGYPTGLEKPLKRKLQMLKAAHDVKDLKVPPGNMLESLKGDLLGYWSIRVNQQYRLVFKWNDETKEATDVHFIDYH